MSVRHNTAIPRDLIVVVGPTGKQIFDIKYSLKPNKDNLLKMFRKNPCWVSNAIQRVQSLNHYACFENTQFM